MTEDVLEQLSNIIGRRLQPASAGAKPPQENDVYARNKAYAKPGSYTTTLSPEQEAKFRGWAKVNPHLVEGEIDNPTPDYDVRGRWLADQSGDPTAKLTRSKFDGKMHASDKWKTPYHRTFSAQSIYATPDAPQWKGDKLVDKTGKVIADETPGKKAAVQPEADWDANDYKRHGMTPPASTPDIESIIGRKLTPVKLEPIVSQRFKIYSDARKNGFDPAGAIKTAVSMGAAGHAPKEQTAMEKFDYAMTSPFALSKEQKEKIGGFVGGIPIGPGAKKTLGDVGKDMGEVLHRAFSNPMGISDEQWAKDQKQVGDYLEQIDRSHLGEGAVGKFAAGADKGGFQFLGEQAAPGQIALLIGTFGESALSRLALKSGIQGAVPAAKTLAKLIQLHFTASMIEGTAQGVYDSIKNSMNGNWEAAGQSAIEGLASGMMAKMAVDHEVATAKVRGVLLRVARVMYGVPEGSTLQGAVTSRFNQLNPFQQGAVIDQTVKASKEYQDVLNSANAVTDAAIDRTKKQQQKRLNDYYGTALSQAFDENVARRTMRSLQGGRERKAGMEAEAYFRGQREEAIKDALAQRMVEYGETRKQAREARVARGQEASERRQEGASDVGRMAQNIANRRQDVWKQRNEAQQEQTADEIPHREVESTLNDDGQVAYPAMYWDEQNTFGVAWDHYGHAVYRQTPRGLEWLGNSGHFTEEPTQPYVAHDPAVADTVARLTALGMHTSGLAEAEGATAEHIADADAIADIRRDLVSGEIDAREAQRRAGIAEKTTLPDEFTAARDGRLNGPFHESSAGGYYDGIKAEAIANGFPQEDIDALLDNYGMLAREQTQNNLNHVYRPGDYIVSKKGVKWTLDSKGMLHPDVDGNPVPLMKRGMYSNTAMQLAESGRVGYGTKTREERRADDSRRRATVIDIQNHQAEMDREMRLAVQRQGLTLAPFDFPRPDIEQKQDRQARIMSLPPRPPSQVDTITGLLFKVPSDANSIIQSIAKRQGVSPEEVMRLQLANDPDRSTTTEAQIARLEVGDAISDSFRKDRPWKVEQGKDGNLYIRSGNASPIKLDRLNPSERVRQLAEKGTITKERPEFTEKDVNRAAYDVPHYVSYQEDLADRVRERAEGKISDPPPRSEKQAEAQVRSAEIRADAAHGVALRAVEDAANPDTDSVEKAEAMADKANQEIKNASKAKAQEIESRTKTAPKGDYPPRAPISIGLIGDKGVIEQNNRQFRYHHELVPIDSLIISHVWNGDDLEENPAFFKPLQPRSPKPEAVRQQRLDANIFAVGDDGRTSGYNFSKYANRTIDAMSGPPLVDSGGMTVSGNGRLRRLIKHLQILNEIGDAEEREARLLGLRSAMRKLAQESGIGRYPDDGTFYADVRMLDEPIETEAKASELGLFFNTSEADAINEGAKGIVYGRTLDDDVLKSVGRIAEASEGGLEAAMREDPTFFAQLVNDKFGIPDSQRSDWFTEDRLGNPILTETGARLFRRAVKGYVIKDVSVLDRIEGSIPDRAFERGLGYIVQLKSFPELDLSGKITEALQAAGLTLNADPGLSNSGDRWLATYHPDQIQLLGMETELPPEPDRVVETLWRALHASTAASPRTFSDRLKNLLADETIQGGMFGDGKKETPIEKFNRIFNKELGEVQHSRGDKTRGISPEEYEAALNNHELSDVERLEAENTAVQEGGRGKSPEQAKGAEAPGSPTGIHPIYTFDKARWSIVAKGDLGGLLTIVRLDPDAFETRKVKAEDFYRDATLVKSGRMEPPPKPPSKEDAAVRELAAAKAQNGYVTPVQLRSFLEAHPATKEHASELMRTARMMAEYVFDGDKPVGVERKDALDWVLQQRLAGIEAGELKTKRGQYSDPNIEKGLGDRIMKLHKAADASTFIHEFAHVIFPMLSDEDLKAIDTGITGGKGHVWDGQRGTLKGDVYKALSEKMAHGVEQYLRDENPTGFSAEVKAVLAKIKEVMRNIYLKFKGDPLSEFQNSEESREVFAKMFNVTENDVPDRWHEEVKRARAEEKKLRKPSEEPHPLVKQASEAGATGIRSVFAGKVEDTVGDRVDPRKPTAVFVFPDINKAATYWSTVATPESKIAGAELIGAEDGTYGVRFNTKVKYTPDMLSQELPEELGETQKDIWREMGNRLHEARKRYYSGDDKSVKEYNEALKLYEMSSPMLMRKFMREQMGNMKSGDLMDVDELERMYAQQQKPTESREFKRWFGDSKVVDEKGEPLRVYHGTNKDFEVFDESRGEKSSQKPHNDTPGVQWFGASPDAATYFGGWREGARSIPVYLSLKKPRIVDMAHKQGAAGFRASGKTVFDIEYDKKFEIDEARDAGNDGVIFKNAYDGTPASGDVYAVFDPSNIKSAIGNRGTFDQNDPSILYQDVPQKHPGIELEETKKRLAATPESTPMIRKLLQLKIKNLENEIRSKYGAETEPVEAAPEVPKEALREVRNGQDADRLRKGTDGVPANKEPQRAGGITKPPTFGRPADAGAGRRGGPSGKPVAGPRVPTSLAEVKPVALEPLRSERGQAVGTVVGEPFDSKAWVASLKTAGLPESLPAPTWALDRKTADMLIFPGQPQVVQTALSALEQGDGAVIASATGTGKTYTGMAVVKEWRAKHPEAKVLYITKNASLLKSAQDVSANTFGFEFEDDLPDRDAPTGVYGQTYSKIIRNEAAKNTKWDLVIADESGEARRWYDEENKQGKMLKAIIANSDKALYFSATPFHSPMEYGYLDKLNMWPKNGFDRWIENNFAHEKIDGKVIARLDPGKQAKLRAQLIERGQLVSQAISYDGFTAHFGVVPVTDQMKRGLDRIHEGFARAKKQLIDMKKKGLAEKISAFEATYTKAFLERERLPQAIELARKAREGGWQVAIFSETSSEDLFRRETGPDEERSTYQQLDDAMGGGLRRIIPPFADVYDNLKEAFGDQLGDYSGRGNSMAEREKAKGDFLSGERPMIYSTYAAGGIGVSLHDADYPDRGVKGGDKPRVAIYLGPPYSGVLLEQAMGRFWRFGVKSDTHAVFLATDSEPDIRLMQQKVGPRMRSLRASVLGERDSLASAMSTYTDDEKVRARQEALAYSEGNEVAVNASDFQVRSKSRNVGINDWSMINFPPADTAKNKGMKYGEDVVGGDWSTLYQEKAAFAMPESPETLAGKSVVDAIGNGIVSGDGLPQGVSVQNLDPSDRDVVMGAASAVATEAVDARVERDKTSTARQTMESQLNLPADKTKWVLDFPNGKKKGVWRYTGPPEDLRGGPSGDRPEPVKDIHAWYGGMVFSQEIGIQSIAKQAGVREVGQNIVRMNRSYQADSDTHFASFTMEAYDIMKAQKLDFEDPRVMNELWNEIEGRERSENPKIIKAAEKLADLHERIHDAEAGANVKLKTPSGGTMSWKEISKDRNFMPHRIDYDAQIVDPDTGETHTLKDVMKETFPEASKRRIISAIAKERGYTYDQVMDYLKAYAPNTPVLGHIHRARTLNFPFIKKDWKTLMGYYKQAADAIAIENNFGNERGKLDKEIARIPSKNGRRTIKHMFDGMLEPQEWDGYISRIYNAAIAYEAATKLTLSPTKVIFHAVHFPVGLKGRVRPVAKAAFNLITHPKEVFENASYAGTIARQLNAADVISKGDDQGITHQIFGKIGFNAAYKVVRAWSGESARVWMDQYALHELKKGNKEEARRILRDVMLIGDKGVDEALANGRFSPEDMAKAQTAFANMTAWSNNPIQMPGWARLHIEKEAPTTTVGLARAVRLTYALQSFSLKTTSFLREHLWDEVMVHKNYKPLAYAMIAAPIVGQMLQGTTAGVKGIIHGGMEGLQGKKHTEDAWDKWLTEMETTFKDPSAARFLKFYIDSVTLSYGMDMVRILLDPFMLEAAGEHKKAGAGDTYALTDVAEHLAGAFYSDLFNVAKLPYDLHKIKTGQGHPEQRGEKYEKTIKKAVTDQFPVLKQFPAFSEPPKKPTTSTRKY